MSESRINNSIKNSGSGLGLKGVQILANFVTRTVFIYLLGIQYTGISSLFTDILGVMSLMEMGIGLAILYSLYKPLSENDYPKIAALMQFYKKTYRIIAVLILATGAACIPLLEYIVKDVPDIKENIQIIFFMFVVNSAFSYLLIYKSTILRAHQKSREIDRIDIGVLLVKVVFQALLLFLFQEYMFFLFIEIIGTIVRNILVSKRVDKLYPQIKEQEHASGTLQKAERKKLFADVRALSLYRISVTMINSTDSIIISSFLGTSLVGKVSNYNLIVTGALKVITQIFSAIKPSIGNLAATSNKDKQYAIFNKLDFLAFFFACFVSSMLFGLINPAIIVWIGEEYLLSLPVVMTIIANLYIAIMVLPPESFRTANGLFIHGKYRPLIMTILNIVLSLLLVINFGVFGVLIATVISRVLTQVWYDPYLVFSRVFQRGVKEYYIQYLIRTLVTIVCCALIYVLNTLFIRQWNIYTFLLSCLISALIPCLAIVVLFHNSPIYRDLLKQLHSLWTKMIEKIKRKLKRSI